MSTSSLCRDSQRQESYSWCLNTFKDIVVTIGDIVDRSRPKRMPVEWFFANIPIAIWIEGTAWIECGQSQRLSPGGGSLVLWTE